MTFVSAISETRCAEPRARGEVPCMKMEQAANPENLTCVTDESQGFQPLDPSHGFAPDPVQCALFPHLHACDECVYPSHFQHWFQPKSSQSQFAVMISSAATSK